MKTTMKNKQFDLAVKIFVDICGEPKIFSKQEMTEWSLFLGDYSCGQVEEAAYKCVKYGKIKGFPTLTHLKAYLFDQPKDVLNEKTRLEEEKNERLRAIKARQDEEIQRKNAEKNAAFINFIQSKGYKGLFDLIMAGEATYKRITFEFRKNYKEHE